MKAKMKLSFYFIVSLIFAIVVMISFKSEHKNNSIASYDVLLKQNYTLKSFVVYSLAHPYNDKARVIYDKKNHNMFYNFFKSERIKAGKEPKEYDYQLVIFSSFDKDFWEIDLYKDKTKDIVFVKILSHMNNNSFRVALDDKDLFVEKMFSKIPK